MTRVVVHIDRLVVGDAAADPREIEAAVAEAIRRELTRPGSVQALTASGDRAKVDAGPVGSELGHFAVGAAIGRALTTGESR